VNWLQDVFFEYDFDNYEYDPELLMLKCWLEHDPKTNVIDGEIENDD
jgi:hypothetical protein